MGVTLAITAAVGLGVGVTGTILSANAKADADRKSAALKAQQADELMSREAINENIMQIQGRRAEDTFANSVGQGTMNTGLSGILRMRSDLAMTLANSQRDAAFKAQMLRQGAEIDTQLASDSQTAGYVSALGQGISGAGQTYSIYKKSSSPGNLYGG